MALTQKDWRYMGSTSHNLHPPRIFCACKQAKNGFSELDFAVNSFEIYQKSGTIGPSPIYTLALAWILIHFIPRVILQYIDNRNKTILDVRVEAALINDWSSFILLRLIYWVLIKVAIFYILQMYFYMKGTSFHQILCFLKLQLSTQLTHDFLLNFEIHNFQKLSKKLVFCTIH
jgi:hypothetical protein